jgi:hypothetical protein
MCQKWLESVVMRRPHIWVKYNLKNFSYYTLPYLTLLYFTFLFVILYSKKDVTISTHDGSNDAVCCKEVPFGSRIDSKLHLGVKISRKPKILEPGCQISSKINTHE